MRRERRAVTFAVLGVLLLTSFAVLALRTAESADERARLDDAANSLATSFTAELQRFADVGIDVGVASARLPQVDAASYEALLDDLELMDRFRGVIGVSFISHVARDRLDEFLADRAAERDGFELHEDAGEDQLRIITYVYPEETNRAALGVDLTARPDSREAADRAIATDGPALSTFTEIIQLGGAPGASLHVPARDLDGVLIGTVGVVVAAEPFVEQLQPVPGHLSVRLLDPSSEVFAEVVRLGPEPRRGAPTTTVPIESAGQTWLLEVAPLQGFSPPWLQRGSTYLTLAGLVAAVMIGLLVRSVTSRERVSWGMVEQRTAQLSEVNEQLASTNRALAAAGRSKDEFLASVSHELRTPLTVISGFVESLDRMHGTEAGIGDLLEPIQRNVRRLDSLVADLLTLASLDAGAVTAFRGSVELSPVLRSAPRELAGLTEGEVVIDVPAGLRVAVDPRHLERVLTNLLVNAVRHGQPPVEIAAFDVGDGSVEFTVRDHGRGIPASAVDDVFERFARGPDTESTAGTGLGLAIVRELIEINGGSVTYEPADPGACFRIRLEGVGADQVIEVAAEADASA